MNLLKLMAVFYFCSIIAKSINNVCFDRPPTIANLQKAQISKCKLAEHSFLYLGFFDFKAHFEVVRGFSEYGGQLAVSSVNGSDIGLTLGIREMVATVGGESLY